MTSAEVDYARDIFAELVVALSVGRSNAPDSSESEALAEKAPLQFGRYTLLRELGQGAAGRVYLARDPELGREIAIKILDRGVAAQPERFRREMGILAALRHPNIVTIYDAGADDGRPYYAMEYAPGRSLAEAKLPLADAVWRLLHFTMDDVWLDDLWRRKRGPCYERDLKFSTLAHLIADALLEQGGSGNQAFERAQERASCPSRSPRPTRSGANALGAPGTMTSPSQAFSFAL